MVAHVERGHGVEMTVVLMSEFTSRAGNEGEIHLQKGPGCIPTPLSPLIGVIGMNNKKNA